MSKYKDLNVLKIMPIMTILTILANAGFLEGVQMGINMNREVDLQRQRHIQALQQEKIIAIQEETLRQQRMLTEAKVREINARTQKIRNNRTRQYTNTYNSREHLNSITVKSNIDECVASFSKKGQLNYTSCLSLTNSKGIKILCTKSKKVCKTEYELSSSFNTQKLNYFTTEKGTHFRVTYNK